MNPRAPHWKTDFSVDWSKTSRISRREFTRFLALGSVTMAVGSSFLAWRAGRPKTVLTPRVAVAAVDELQPGGNLLFNYPEKGHPAILLRHEDGSFDAFSQECTHLGCTVFPREGRLECPCHEGFFDAHTGGVLSGPPQRPLPRVKLEIADGQIFAVGGGEA